VLVNFYTMDLGKVTDEVGTLFATNQNIRVCPGESGRLFETTCLFASRPVTIIAANGHFHNRGVRFSISPFDSQAGAGASFYENLSWDDPKFERSLMVPVPQGGGVHYSCEFQAPASECGNPDDQCCFTFGGNVATQEHCNAFVYFYPKFQDTDVNCF